MLNMKSYVLSLVFSGHNPDIFRRNEAIDPFDSLPQEGIFSCDLEHLFGAGFPTQGPEAGPGTACKNDSMNVTECLSHLVIKLLCCAVLLFIESIEFIEFIGLLSLLGLLGQECLSWGLL
jgi:hypothetical protein